MKLRKLCLKMTGSGSVHAPGQRGLLQQTKFGGFFQTALKCKQIFDTFSAKLQHGKNEFSLELKKS